MAVRSTNSTSVQKEKPETKKDLLNKISDLLNRLALQEEAIAAAEREAERQREEAATAAAAAEAVRVEAERAQADWQRRLEQAEQQAAQMVNAAGIARADAVGGPHVQLIEKPHGRFSLPEVMENTANILYDEYRLILRLLHSVAGLLEVNRSKKDQNKDSEAAVRNLMLEHFPVLRRFRNEWPLTEFIGQYLQSQRGYQRRMGLLPPAKPRNYTTTPEQRKARGKAANAVSQALKRDRIHRALEHRRRVDRLPRNDNIDPALL